MMNKVVITGGAGFIGSSLVRHASKLFDEVVVVDNLVNGKKENLEEITLKNLVFVEADIRDKEIMRTILKDTDVVYHLACLGVRHSIHSPWENHNVNATATLDLLALSREQDVKRFLYVSSSEIYGTAHSVPITEETPTFPHTVYGSSKLAGDCYTRAYWDTYKFPTTVVRPFNSYGPRSHHEGDSGEVIPKFILRSLAGQPLILFGDGLQTRDFMYVEETAHWILQAGLSEKTVGKTLNLGSGSEIQILELAKTILRLTSQPESNLIFEESRPGDVLRLWADSTHAEKLLGFSPRISLAKGLESLLLWYQEQNINVSEMLKDEVVKNWMPSRMEI